MATVYINGASIDENGKAHGGKAGNQTGRELRKQKWYLHSKGWRVFRAKSAEVAEKIAVCAEAAVANQHIGYDQYERNTLYNEARQYNFDVSKVTKDVECDCSALVRVCCAYAGVMGLPEGFRTTNEPKNLLVTGMFIEMTGDQYQKKADYLKRGDILCTPVQGHTVVVVTSGDKAEPTLYRLGERTLKKGCKGSDVTDLQADLMKLGYALPKYGADGDYGSETVKAVKAFQKAKKLTMDGEMQSEDYTVLFAALAGQDVELGTEPPTTDPIVQHVRVTGGLVNVRSAPGTKNTRILGTVRKGEELLYQGLTSDVDGTDWHLVEFEGQNGWISGKFSEVI